MNEIDIIRKEKLDFISQYSMQFYQELSNKSDNNETIVFVIAKLLLNPQPLVNCNEYQILTKYIDENEVIKNDVYLSNILGYIIQILNRIGSSEHASVILSYFNVIERLKNNHSKQLIYR